MSDQQPASRDAEFAVLAAAMEGKAEVIAEQIDGRAFFFPDLREVWLAIEELVERGSEVDPVAVITRNESLRDMVVDIATNAISANWQIHCRTLNSLKRKRGLIENAHLLAGAALQNADDGVLLQILRACEQAYTEADGSDFITMKDALKRTFEGIESRVDGTVVPVATGLRNLDAKLKGGFRPGTVHVFAGRPSMGKSALTSFLLDYISYGVPTLDFTIEDTLESRVERLIASRGRIKLSTVQGMEIDEDHWRHITDGMEQLSSRHRLFSEATTPRDILRAIRAGHAQHGVKVVLIDYLQLISFSGDDRKADQIGAFCAALKRLCKETGIIALLVSQLSRACEARPDKRPIMSDLRDSGTIEQDADGIWMLYRDYVYRSTQDPTALELICRKNRNGSIGTVKLRCFLEKMAFADAM